MQASACPFLRKAGAAVASPAGATALCALATKCPHVNASGLNPAVVLARLAGAPIEAVAAPPVTASQEQLSNPCCGEHLGAGGGGVAWCHWGAPHRCGTARREEVHQRRRTPCGPGAVRRATRCATR